MASARQAKHQRKERIVDLAQKCGGLRVEALLEGEAFEAQSGVGDPAHVHHELVRLAEPQKGRRLAHTKRRPAHGKNDSTTAFEEDVRARRAREIIGVTLLVAPCFRLDIS